jgi:hypothetical protein
MRRILVFLATMVAGVLLASGVALAAAVSEVEPNDSIAGAQAIAASSFDLTENADITDSTTVPHASVDGGGGTAPETPTLDYYSFTVSQAGTTGTFDLDGTEGGFGCNFGWDSHLRLLDSSGTVLALNDDSVADPGSTDDSGGGGFTCDSYIPTGSDGITLSPYTFETPGTYYIEVGRCCIGDRIGVPPPIPNTSTYDLHVSIADPPADTTPPSVVVSPEQGQTGVSPTANVTATFSEQVQGVTKSTFKLERVVVNKRGVIQFKGVRAPLSTQVVGTGADAFTEATLDPAKDLSGSYRVTITNGVTDMAGNPLDPWTSNFTTAGSPG